MAGPLLVMHWPLLATSRDDVSILIVVSRYAFQSTVESISNKVCLLSKGRSMVQGQYSAPLLVSGSVMMRC